MFFCTFFEELYPVRNVLGFGDQLKIMTKGGGLGGSRTFKGKFQIYLLIPYQPTGNKLIKGEK